jgi:hypothetical protein
MGRANLSTRVTSSDRESWRTIVFSMFFSFV